MHLRNTVTVTKAILCISSSNPSWLSFTCASSFFSDAAVAVTLLCSSAVCFSHQETARGSFLLKPTDTLILKQPHEANLQPNHFRCFHKKSTEKCLSLSFSLSISLPLPHPLPPLWAVFFLQSWNSVDKHLTLVVSCWALTLHLHTGSPVLQQQCQVTDAATQVCQLSEEEPRVEHVDSLRCDQGVKEELGDICSEETKQQRKGAWSHSSVCERERRMKWSQPLHPHLPPTPQGSCRFILPAGSVCGSIRSRISGEGHTERLRILLCPGLFFVSKWQTDKRSSSSNTFVCIWFFINIHIYWFSDGNDKQVCSPLSTCCSDSVLNIVHTVFVCVTMFISKKHNKENRAGSSRNTSCCLS